MSLINSLFPISIIFLMMEISFLIHSYDIHLHYSLKYTLFLFSCAFKDIQLFSLQQQTACRLYFNFQQFCRSNTIYFFICFQINQNNLHSCSFNSDIDSAILSFLSKPSLIRIIAFNYPCASTQAGYAGLFVPASTHNHTGSFVPLSRYSDITSYTRLPGFPHNLLLLPHFHAHLLLLHNTQMAKISSS